MKKSLYVKKMFNDISPKYDLLNDILSLGLHRLWKQKFVKEVMNSNPEHLIDCATGTGDLAFLAEAQGAKKIIGIDFSDKMIAFARARAQRRLSRTEFETADILALPYPDKAFDAAMVSFGVRNLEDLEKGLRELSRVSRSLYVLEFGQPTNKILSRAYFSLLKLYVPVFGLITGRKDAYEYLIRSSQEFPSGDDFTRILRQATDYQEIHYRPIFGGIAYSYHCAGGLP